jgi:predicted HTH transcriptional regulator
MPNGIDLQFYILHGKEERYLEYKRSMIWTGNDTTKVKIAKAMMAMANLRNGGVIVVGMQETTRGTWVPEVMTPQQISSFTQDDVAQWVNDYATPAVQFSVGAFAIGGNQFVILQVQEFDTSPVICRKQKTSGGESLEAGAIYYRRNRKIESAPISSDEDLRELIGLAVDKGISRHVSRLHRLGLIPAESAKQLDSAQYEKERNGL